ncbi:hypothetical protein ACTMSW_26030 [Micromonospora sp. BQ11]|uniref:hypothetical protein n=1 Tax=Micromonospora sp. BQ11 TaxID=3452212 RepID=UPI003F896C21
MAGVDSTVSAIKGLLNRSAAVAAVVAGGGLQGVQEVVGRGEVVVVAWWCPPEQVFGRAVAAFASEAEANTGQGGMAGKWDERLDR